MYTRRNLEPPHFIVTVWVVFSKPLPSLPSAPVPYCEHQGFSVEGRIGSSDSNESYIEKCVYVEGTGDSSSPLDGFVMEGLSIENCGWVMMRFEGLQYSSVQAALLHLSRVVV